MNGSNHSLLEKAQQIIPRQRSRIILALKNDKLDAVNNVSLPDITSIQRRISISQKPGNVLVPTSSMKLYMSSGTYHSSPSLRIQQRALVKSS